MTHQDGTAEVTGRADASKKHYFDELAKGLAVPSLSRQDALKWIGGALLGGVLASIPGVAWAAAPNKKGPVLDGRVGPKTTAPSSWHAFTAVHAGMPLSRASVGAD